MCIAPRLASARPGDIQKPPFWSQGDVLWVSPARGWRNAGTDRARRRRRVPVFYRADRRGL